MSTFRNPVGPQSSRVYWRRRLAVLVILLAVVVVVVLIVSRLGSGAAEPAVSSSGDATPMAQSPAPPAVAVAGAPCDPAQVEIDAIADQNSYAPGELPQLSFTITNLSGVACTLNVGTTQQVFSVTSGADVYWSSADCLTEPVDAEVILEPNLGVTSTPIGWDRTRSTVDTCGTDRSAVPAGGATYNLDVTVGVIAAVSPVSFLLN